MMRLDRSHDFVVSRQSNQHLVEECSENWQVRVFNIISFEEVETSHPHYPESLYALHSVLRSNAGKKPSIRSIYFLEDMILVGTGHQLMAVVPVSPKEHKRGLIGLG